MQRKRPRPEAGFLIRVSGPLADNPHADLW